MGVNHEEQLSTDADAAKIDGRINVDNVDFLTFILGSSLS